MDSQLKNKSSKKNRVGEEDSDVSDVNIMSDASESRESVGSTRSATKDHESRKRSLRRSESSGSDREGGRDGGERHLFLKPQSSKRGRGRPPTTDQYAALAQSQEILNIKKKEALRLEGEEQILKAAKSLDDLEGAQTAEELVESAQKAVTVVLEVAKRSRSLKGTMVNSLRKAAAAIQKSVTELCNRTPNEEVKLLRAANARQEQELSIMRLELAGVKTALEACNGPESVQKKQEAESAMRRAIVLEFGAIINARFAGIEDRLLPEKRLRPPLMGDTATVQGENPALRVESSPTEAASSRLVEVPASNKTPSQKKSSKPKKKSKKDKKKDESQLEALPPAADDGWVTVGKGGKSEKPGGKSKVPPSNHPELKKKGLTHRLRTPRTSAVAITLQPGAEERGISYASILKEAKAKLPMETLGIPSVRIRAAATGARLFEIPGDFNREKAKSLAAELKKALNSEDVVIASPTKCAELRISGLDESVTSSEVANAIVGIGGCQLDEIRTGELRFIAPGNGTLWVRCPVAVAKKVAVSKFLVGWVSARVDLLKQRPMRCYRCLERGHVRATCKSVVDRSDSCYRCGKQGHIARNCVEPPSCPLCVAAGIPAAHIIGSKFCKESDGKSNAKAMVKTTQAPTNRLTETTLEVMDTTSTCD